MCEGAPYADLPERQVPLPVFTWRVILTARAAAKLRMQLGRSLRSGRMTSMIRFLRALGILVGYSVVNLGANSDDCLIQFNPRPVAIEHQLLVVMAGISFVSRTGLEPAATALKVRCSIFSRVTAARLSRQASGRFPGSRSRAGRGTWRRRLRQYRFPSRACRWNTCSPS